MSRSPTRRPPCRQGGFTFLELLLVVSILAGIAMLAFATTSDVEDQRRFEDTQQRLLAIRRAVLGVGDPAWDGQVRLSGFVADNGVLPGSLSELTSIPTGFLSYGAKTPLFDAQPDSNCLSDGTTTSLTDYPLFKGWRGRYLPAAPGATGFRDGWGNHSITGDDATNFGWAVSTASDGFGVTSRARDNAGGGSGYDADVADAVAAADWRVDLNGWQVQIANRNTTTALPASGSLRVSVLAYVSDGAGGKWKRVTSAAVGSIAANSTATVTFNGYCDNATAGSSLVAQGRHLVVLVSDTDASAHNSTDALADADSVTAGTQYAARSAAFFANADRPALTLEIK